MHLISGRFAIALGFSTAAHAGLAWMVGDQLPSTAAPAQRALTVAMAPAAPRAVLNSIAPTVTAALSPALVRPLAAPRVAVIDEPDRVLAARVVDAVEAPAAPPIEARAAERRLHAREVESSVVVAALARSEMRISTALQRDTIEKPLPPRLDAAPATRTTVRAAPARPGLAATSAAESVVASSGSGSPARSPPAVTGRPGANRQARPASGNDPPQYPWTARVQGHQGRVVLSVWVSAEGAANRLAVLQSSGYPSLDRAAVAAVQGWRFRPARRAGTDTGSLLYVPVVFRLDGG